MSSTVVTQAQLLETVKQLKQSGKRIVATNGCFDLLHMGHVRYLQAAKAQGDTLIVLLNSDVSVRGLKGPTRPIVDEANRAELLASLRCVDWVCVFTEPSPIALLKQIHPDVVVKGAQYNEATLPEAPELKALGVQLVFVPMIEGQSTTQLIERVLATVQPSTIN